MFTAIGHQNIGHWAGLAEAGFPGLRRVAIFQQAAFFNVTAPEVVSIKVTAFFSSWCTHGRDYSTAGGSMKAKAPHFCGAK